MLAFVGYLARGSADSRTAGARCVGRIRLCARCRKLLRPASSVVWYAPPQYYYAIASCHARPICTCCRPQFARLRLSTLVLRCVQSLHRASYLFIYACLTIASRILNDALRSPVGYLLYPCAPCPPPCFQPSLWGIAPPPCPMLLLVLSLIVKASVGCKSDIGHRMHNVNAERDYVMIEQAEEGP